MTNDQASGNDYVQLREPAVTRLFKYICSELF